MAIIRQVLQSETSGKWAYCEWSDESKNPPRILGDGEPEFNTQMEAEIHARQVTDEDHNTKVGARRPKFSTIGQAFMIAWGEFAKNNKEAIDALPDGLASIKKEGERFTLNYSPNENDLLIQLDSSHNSGRRVDFCRLKFPGQTICSCSECVARVNEGSWLKDQN